MGASLNAMPRLQTLHCLRTGRSPAVGLRDEAAAEIGREQPGSLHELIGHDNGDGFRSQQANENEDLHGASLDRSPAAQKHSDKGSWQRDQTHSARLVECRHEGFWQPTLNHLADRHRAR